MSGFVLRVPFLAYPRDELLFLDLFQLALRDNIAGPLHITQRNVFLSLYLPFPSSLSS